MGSAASIAQNVDNVINSMQVHSFDRFESSLGVPITLIGRICVPSNALVLSPVSSSPCVYYCVHAYKSKLFHDKPIFKEVFGIKFYINGNNSDKLIKVDLQQYQSSISSDISSFTAFSHRDKSALTEEIQKMCYRHSYDPLYGCIYKRSKRLKFQENRIHNGDIIKIFGYIDRNCDPYDTIASFEIKPLSYKMIQDNANIISQFTGYQSSIAQLTINPSIVISRKSNYVTAEIPIHNLDDNAAFAHAEPIDNDIGVHAQVISTEPLDNNISHNANYATISTSSNQPFGNKVHPQSIPPQIPQPPDYYNNTDSQLMYAQNQYNGEVTNHNNQSMQYSPQQFVQPQYQYPPVSSNPVGQYQYNPQSVPLYQTGNVNLNYGQGNVAPIYYQPQF